MKYFLAESAASFEKKAVDLPDGDPLLFAFRGGKLLLTSPDAKVPSLAHARELGLELSRTTGLGVYERRSCVVSVLEAGSAVPAGLEEKSLLRLFGILDFDLLAVAAVASQVAHFYLTSRFCSQCGGPMTHADKEHSARCEPCKRHVYPQVSPCVIVLVHDDRRILLTRQPQFPKGMFGLVAGFIEPGESFEACARREIEEEVGLSVTDLRYVASQPWPFPSQLMIGMMARYQSGELRVDTSELEEAAWFDLDNLPVLPPPVSIARHLIELYRQDKS